MSEKKITEEIARGLTPRALAVGLVYSIIVAVIMSYFGGILLIAASRVDQYGGNWFAQWDTAPLLQVFFIFIPALLIGLMPMKARFTRQELGIIAAMISVGPILAYPFYSPVTSLNFIPGTLEWGPPWNEYALKWIPDHWGPKDPAIYKGFNWGGQAVPWGDWAPYLGFWLAFYGVFILMFAFAAVLTRRLIVDVVALPFPLAQAYVRIANDATMQRPRSAILGKFLWLGIILGCLINIGSVLNFWIPSIPHIRARVELSALVLVPWMCLQFGFDPAWIGFGFLMPIDILVSAIIWFIAVAWLLFPIEFSMGLLPGATRAALDSTNTIYGWGIGFGKMVPVLHPYGFNPIWMGILVSVIGYYFWVGRSESKAILSSIIKPRPKEITAEEPISQRSAWIGLIVTFILMVILLLPTPIWLSVLFLLALLLTYYGYAMIQGDSGWGNYHVHLGPWYFGNTAFLLLATGGAAVWGNQGMMAALTLTTTLVYWMSAYWNPLPKYLEAFKIAKDTKTRNKDMLIALLLSSIVCLVVGFVVYLIFNYSMGALSAYTGGWPTGYGGAWYILWGAAAITQEPGAWWGGNVWGGEPGPPTYPAIYADIIVGMLIGGLVFWARRKKPGLPLHPIGFLLPFFMGGAWLIFPTLLISLIFKYLVMKVGGVRLYEEKGVPLFLGLFISGGILTFLKNLGGVLIH